MPNAAVAGMTQHASRFHAPERFRSRIGRDHLPCILARASLRQVLGGLARLSIRRLAAAVRMARPADNILAEPEPSPGSLPPGPPLTALPAVLRALRKDPLALLSALTREYGDVVRIPFWLWDAYVVWQPDHVKHVLQERHAIYTKENVD